MGKDKTTKSESSFQRFETFTKNLLAVPKKELDKEIAKYKRKKKNRKS